MTSSVTLLPSYESRESTVLVGLSALRLNTSLVAYLHRCADATAQGQVLSWPTVRPSVYSALKRHLRDRLAADQVEQLLADYRAGVLRRDLAEQYGISISSLAPSGPAARLASPTSQGLHAVGDARR